MARRFSFGWDRTEKALKLPWFLLVVLAGRLIPRNPKLWVFSRRTGFGDGPLALLEEVRRFDATIQVAWLTCDSEDDALASASGVPFRRRSSMSALWLCLRASCGVTTHGFSDLRGPAIWGAFVVQLWHGSPLKRIGLDISAKRIKGWRRLVSPAWWSLKFERFWNSHYDLIVAASDLVRPRMVSAFGVEADKVQALGDPRCDGIQFDEEQARSELSRIIGRRADGSRIVLFAPTWREGGEMEAMPSNEEWLAIGELMERSQSLLLLRLHPSSGANAVLASVPRIAFISPEICRDILPILGAVDVLLTDYSSIAMDFSLLNRPIIFLAPDLPEYERYRGLYESYQEFTGGTWSVTWHQAIGELTKILTDDWSPDLAAVEHMRVKYHKYQAGDNAGRVLNYIAPRVGLSRA